MDKTRVFVVEDEAIIAADLCQRLQALGFEVVGSVGHGERALALIPPARPDLVLMDIVIKGPINGIETARRLRMAQDIPVVFLTSHADADTVRRAVDTNPFGYVLKPYNERELQVAIQIALHRHGVESELRRMERWMATTLASIGDGVVATDRQGTVTLLNDAARRITGWSGDEALGRPLGDVFRVSDGRDGTPLTGLVERGLADTITLGVEHPVLLQRRDGEVVNVDDSIAPIRDGAGAATGVVVVFRDATDQVWAEQMERDKLAAELASRQKTHFLSRISHELRTPLNAILGFTQLLQLDESRPLDAIQRGRLEKVRHAGGHLLELVNDVLDLTRIEEGARPLERVPVDVGVVLETTCAMLESQARERDIRILKHAGGAPPAWADTRALEQVLINLLSNGIKYNRAGGRLEVALSSTEGRVEVNVRDQGAGLDAGQLEQLFQPFNRLGAENSNVEGSGLGLVIARSLVEAMGGELTVVSARGVGTCFTVRLPGAAQETAHRPVPSTRRAPAAAELPPATLLYVEDEPLNALLLTEALRGVPQWRVVLAEDGRQGLELARRLRPDLVLLDINLPVLTGDQMVRALRSDAATRDLRCIALSADALPEQMAAAHAAGFDAYWTKPLDLGMLVERLRVQLTGGPALPQAAA
ncbi:MAG TPA: response regulator [Methylibium sp.]|nr:response regulator [Methylibium sp.]